MAGINPMKHNIVWACQDDFVFGPWFKGLDSWGPWLTFLRHLFGLRCSPNDLRFIQERTGRIPKERHRYSEAWLVVGRRGGKSFILAIIAVYLAFFIDWKKNLGPGEFGNIVIIAQDRKQARVILRYIKGLVKRISLFRSKVTRETQWSMEFQENQIAIEIYTTSFRATRGYTIVAALLDEVAFWRAEETANPDDEIVNAILPGMATMPGAMLLAASSPYAKRGVLYKNYQDYFGKDDPGVVVWHGETRVMNPAVSESYINRQYDRDPVRAAAEYGAQFRSDIEDFVPPEIVDACIENGVFERPCISTVNYLAFADPSGGSRDSFTLAIGHIEEGQRVLDAVREWKSPFSPDAVVEEASDLMKSYHLNKVMGDQYAGMWPRERFQKQGIHYEPCTTRKSDLYRDALPLLHTGEVRLLDHRRMKTQIVSLERKQSRGGRFTIDHPPGAMDDVANAVLGLMATMKLLVIDYKESDFLIGPRLVGTDAPIATLVRPENQVMEQV